MRYRLIRALAVLSGAVALFGGSVALLTPAPQQELEVPCAPRLLEREQAVCEPLARALPRSAEIALRDAP